MNFCQNVNNNNNKKKLNIFLDRKKKSTAASRPHLRTYSLLHKYCTHATGTSLENVLNYALAVPPKKYIQLCRIVSAVHNKKKRSINPIGAQENDTAAQINKSPHEKDRLVSGTYITQNFHIGIRI